MDAQIELALLHESRVFIARATRCPACYTRPSLHKHVLPDTHKVLWRIACSTKSCQHLYDTGWHPHRDTAFLAWNAAVKLACL